MATFHSPAVSYLESLLPEHSAPDANAATSPSIRITSFPEAITRVLSGFAILDVSPSGVIGFATEKALALLERHFPNWIPETIQRLPTPLLAWLKCKKSSEEHSVSLVWIQEESTEQLIVRLTGTQDGYFQLLLEEVSDTVAAKRLEQLGLTPRESEVLLWISRGKTDAEVATILGCTFRTVTKHTEHIRSKLRVETRTAAAAIALDLVARR